MVKNMRPSSVSTALKLMATSQKDNTSERHLIGKYTIKLANTLEEREAAYRLAYKVYLDKGYVIENSNGWLVKEYDAYADTAVLIVQDQNKNIAGTITMVFDGKIAIPAEAIYNNEIKALRAHNEKIVEISRLAIDNEHRNAKEILVLLFNYLYIYSYFVMNYTCLTIEVNPRHKDYYRSLLCFDVIGAEKPCPNVQNAPAVLLYLSLSRGEEEVNKCLSEKMDQNNRSLYQFFLNSKQEELVIEYLRKQNKPISEDEKCYFGFFDSKIGVAAC